jgi:2-hydroxychromene-2-carboxylate isomerase
MSGRLLCCRYEPSLEDLLAEDEVMMPVLRSAGLDRSELRALLVETARRLEDRERGGEGRTGFGAR